MSTLLSSLCSSQLSSGEPLSCFCHMNQFVSPTSLFLWNHTVYILFLMTYFTQHKHFEMNSFSTVYQQFMLFIDEQHSIAWIYQGCCIKVHLKIFKVFIIVKFLIIYFQSLKCFCLSLLNFHQTFLNQSIVHLQHCVCFKCTTK